MHEFRRGMRELARGLRQVAEAAAGAEDGAARPGNNVNVERRTNVRVTANIGRRGAGSEAAGAQRAPTRQRAGKHGA